MTELLMNTFKSLEQADIHYLLIRDGDRIEKFLTGGEVDLLVRESQLKQLHSMLVKLNYVRLPGWGHSPHHFYIAYDDASENWIKLDIVAEINYGKPIQNLRTTLASGCLANRRRNGPVFIPSPEDELVMLLLHCVLDKGNFTVSRRQRLQELRPQVTDERYLSTLLVSYWLPTVTWPWLAALIDAGNWTALLSQRKAVIARLASRDRLGVIARQVRDRAQRRLGSWLTGHRPRAVSLALLAPDGAGKSAVAASLRESFYFPVHVIYMGLYPKKASRSTVERLPGLSFFSRLLRMWGNYLAAHYHLARRRSVIFDRYPYDSLLAPRQKKKGIQKIRHWLLTHPMPAPDLVILLDAPGETLFARKGEHNADFLEQQRQSYLKLRNKIPHLLVIDATRDIERVCSHVTSLVWRGYIGRQAGLAASQFIQMARREGIPI